MRSQLCAGWIACLLITHVASAADPPAAPTSNAEEQERVKRLLAEQQAPPPPPLEVAPGAVTARDVSFTSATLGRTMHYRVLLPTSYATTHRHYPVLYMLHGFLNPYYEWDRQTRLARYLADYQLVVVLVQGDNSFYINSATDPRQKYMTYFFHDLLPDVRARFRVIGETYGQAVAGVSMGGYGALLDALRFPQMFAFAASFAGVPDVMHDADLARNLAPYGVDKLFGPMDGSVRRDNNVMALAEKIDPNEAPVPYLYLALGNDDPFVEQNLRLAALLRRRGIRHELHLIPGAHEWDVWDKQLPAMLQAMAAQMPIDR